MNQLIPVKVRLLLLWWPKSVTPIAAFAVLGLVFLNLKPNKSQVSGLELLESLQQQGFVLVKPDTSSIVKDVKEEKKEKSPPKKPTLLDDILKDVRKHKEWNETLFKRALKIHSQKKASYLSYIKKYKKLAYAEQNRTGIPAQITLAQGLIESSAGQSDLARHAQNHFGVKSWNGKGYPLHDDCCKHGRCKKSDLFKEYKTVEESYKDHSTVLAQRRYSKLPKKNRWLYAVGLERQGYATARYYAETLVALMWTYREEL